MPSILSNKDFCLSRKGGRLNGNALNKGHGFGLGNIRETNEGKIEIGLATGTFFLISLILLLGIFYLYEVNSIATQGFEVKDIEGKIQELDKESQKLKIREVELKSMNSIERALEEFNLVSSQEVSYVEVPGPMAMK
ncbi:MAG: hypothetical protein NTZ97_03875 [Candidatus Moranbacteria bacterium]|nr:hypothetical protein [Candidatus Moranbacteria bacterium]